MYTALLFLFSFLAMLHLICFASSWFIKLLSIVFYSPTGVFRVRRGNRTSNAPFETTLYSGIPHIQVRVTLTAHGAHPVSNATRTQADSLVSVDSDNSRYGARVDSARVSTGVRTPAPVDLSSPAAAVSAPLSPSFYGVSYGKPRSPAPLSSTPRAILAEETHRADLNSAEHIAQVSFDMVHDVDAIGAWLARNCGAFAGRVYPPVPFFDRSATECQRLFMRLDLVQPETTDLGIHYVVLVVEVVPPHESSTIFTIIARGESGLDVRRIGLQFHGVFATVDDFVLMDWQSGCAPLGSFLSEDYQQLGRNVRWEKEADIFLRRHDMPEQKWAHDELCAVWQERLGGRMDEGMYASQAYDDFEAEELGGQCQDNGDRWDDDSMVNVPPESIRSSSSLDDDADAFDLGSDSLGSSPSVHDDVSNPLELDFNCFGSGYSLDEVASDYSSPPRTPRSDAEFSFSTASPWPPSTPAPRTPEFCGFRCPTSSSTFSTTSSTLSSTLIVDDLMDDPFVLEPTSFRMPRTAAA